MKQSAAVSPLDAPAAPLELGSVICALADDWRRAIVTELALDDLRGALPASYGLRSGSTRRHHVGVLVDAGLIELDERAHPRLRREQIDHAFPRLLSLLRYAGEPVQTHDRAAPG